MFRNNKFWWFVAVCVVFTLVVISTLAVLFWRQLSAPERVFLIRLVKDQIEYVFSALVLLLAGAGFALDWVFRIYILPLNQLAEETALIYSVNPAHRLNLEGAKDIVQLTKTINEMADRFEMLHREVDAKIKQAQSEAEEEKNILAAIMAELPEGVLICNKDGQIILYNKRARLFFSSDPANGTTDAAPSSEPFIGLGRSVFNVVDKNIIVHALDEIAAKLQRAESDVASYFVVTGKKNTLLRAEAVPILDNHKEFTGFILIFYDITQQLAKDNRVDFLLRALVRKIRAGMAGIRSAIDAILAYPTMNPSHHQKLNQIIQQESIAISQLIETTSSEYRTHMQYRWPLTRMYVRDLLDMITKKSGDKLDVDISIRGNPGDDCVRVDSYALVMVMLFLESRLSEMFGCRQMACEVRSNDQFVMLDLIWEGKPVRMEIIRQWYTMPVAVADENLPMTLQEVIAHHHAEIWSFAHAETHSAYLRVLLPVVRTERADVPRDLTILSGSRPEFFDFDLFSQPGQKPELDNRLLQDLTYTVFDTETTGLDPSEDEIISIGAVRIVNGRLLRNETFDQLVDPRRPVPWESVQIHGIQPDMLCGQPMIDEVLSRFFQFAEGTVLVAHNAAFDMKMLQIKESASGIRFTQPVLDTMLLSAVIHPGQNDHNLEGIAQRLGIRVFGRHTALGDAIATAEVFLKQIPFLEDLDIKTLKQARAASQKTYYARRKY